MLAAAIIAGVVALACLLWALNASSKARAATEAATTAETARLEAVAAAEGSAAAAASATAEAEAARADASTARAQADQAAARAESAASDASSSSERLQVVQGELAEATARADAADLARGDAERAAELAEQAKVAAVARAEAAEIRLVDLSGRATALEAGPPPADATSLWALERRRLARLWRERVAVVPDDPAPVDVADDQVRAAVDVLAEASREESGVGIDVRWTLDSPVPDAHAVAVVRCVEELLAAARRSDGGELLVAGGNGGGVLLELRLEPTIELPDDLVEALRDLGAAPVAGAEDTRDVIGVHLAFPPA